MSVCCFISSLFFSLLLLSRVWLRISCCLVHSCRGQNLTLSFTSFSGAALSFGSRKTNRNLSSPIVFLLVLVFLVVVVSLPVVWTVFLFLSCLQITYLSCSLCVPLFVLSVRRSVRPSIPNTCVVVVSGQLFVVTGGQVGSWTVFRPFGISAPNVIITDFEPFMSACSR